MRNVILSFFLFIFPILFPICTCHVRDERGNTPQNSLTQDVDFRLLDDDNFPEYITSETPKNKETTTNVWDVTDVDVSQTDIAKKLIALTFDDTPARNLENILAVFASYNETHPSCKATATLFVNGYLTNAESLPLLSAAYAMQFEIGNHTHSHLDLTKLNAEDVRNEIDQTDKILQKVDGKPRHLLRAPFGKSNQTVQAQVSVPIINWSIDTLDWTGISAEEIYDSVISKLFSGAIVLMHDGVENTVDALKRLLPELEKQGYQAVSVSQLVKVHNCTLRNGKEYVRARKQ